MEGLNVEVNAEKVNQYLANAILESVLGEEIKKAIKEKLADYSLRNTIQASVNSHISKIIYQLLQEEHGEEIKKAVKDKMSEGIVTELASKALDKWLAEKTEY